VKTLAVRPSRLAGSQLVRCFRWVVLGLAAVGLVAAGCGSASEGSTPENVTSAPESQTAASESLTSEPSHELSRCSFEHPNTLISDPNLEQDCETLLVLKERWSQQPQQWGEVPLAEDAWDGVQVSSSG